MRLVLALLAAALALVPLPAAAEYPERPLNLVVGYPAGGMVDIVARPLAEGLKKKFPKGVAVVNRPGAGGSIAMAETAQAKADGYSIVITPLSTLVIHPQLNDLPYRTPDDYEPFVNVVSYYPLLVVRADAPWKSAQEFVAAAKANPGKIRYGSPGEGTSSHINMEEFQRHSGAKLTHVPFAGWAESSAALLGGHIEAVVAQPGEAKPHYESQRMRVLAVFQPKRNQNFADVPAAAELGWPVHNGVWFLLVAPKGTPAPVVKYLHDAAKAAMEDPAFVKVIQSRAIDVDYRPGDRLRADLWQEYKQHTDILKRLGLLKK